MLQEGHGSSCPLIPASFQRHMAEWREQNDQEALSRGLSTQLWPSKGPEETAEVESRSPGLSPSSRPSASPCHTPHPAFPTEYT